MASACTGRLCRCQVHRRAANAFYGPLWRCAGQGQTHYERVFILFIILFPYSIVNSDITPYNIRHYLILIILIIYI